MLAYISGDIFSSKAPIIVNPVNMSGETEEGQLESRFKEKYPDMYEKYMAACEKKSLAPGVLLLCKGENGQKILLFPVKYKAGDPVDPLNIKAGLLKIAASYKKKNITELAFPQIAPDDMPWSELWSLMVQYLGDLPIRTIVYKCK